jgi:hypothetical protein
VAALTTAQIAGLVSDDLNALGTAQFAALTTAQVAALTPAQIASITTDDLTALTTAQYAALATAQAVAITTDQISSIETADLRALTSTSLRALTDAQLGQLTTEQLTALGGQVINLTSSQLAGLASEDLNAFTQSQFSIMSTAQISNLTTAQVASLETVDLRAISTAAWQAMTTEQIVAITTDQFQALSTTQISALTTGQAASLTTDQIVALTTDQIAGLQTVDIAAMSMTQVAAFEAADIGAMTSPQVDAVFLASPIMLDLDGNGVRTTAAENGVMFDLNATGNAHKVGWASASDGLLVMDRNGDGRIGDGTELFGVATQRADGTRAGNGYAAMALEDSNGDSILSAADANFAKLQLWVDANVDGKTDAGELHGLAEFGVVSLDLKGLAGTEVDNGNLLGLVSSYTGADGTQHAMADVWFAKDISVQAAAPRLDELLAAPAAELLPSGPASAAPASGTTTAGTGVAAPAGFDRSLLPIDDNRHQPLI